MKCHDVQRMIQGFIEKRLTDEQLEAFLEHIASCRDCYDELEVYYMITTGLLQLDEEHSETLDFKKNLSDFIESERNIASLKLYVIYNRTERKNAERKIAARNFINIDFPTVVQIEFSFRHHISLCTRADFSFANSMISKAYFCLPCASSFL